MLKFIIENHQENIRTHLMEWRPLYPNSRVARFDTREHAERIMTWLYPNHPSTVRVVSIIA